MSFTSKDSESFIQFEKNGWERNAAAYHDHWGSLSAQSARPMLQAAGLKPGMRILDIATGAGYIAATAAEMGANSIGLDFSEAQVLLARQTYPEIEFCQGDAQNLPFGNESFDVVAMGFGMNHLPDPGLAASEAWRILKPGGVFAFTVWATPASGEAFGIVLNAIERHGVPNLDLPAAPPYFRFADEQGVRAVLSPVGFSDISTKMVPQYWRHTSPAQLFDAFNEGAVRATAMLKSQTEDVRKTIRRVVESEVKNLRSGNAYIIPVPAMLSVGHK